MKHSYLALLRGVNVSGKNPIKMKEFQAFLESNGFENVSTYIQSGNILFESNDMDNKKIAEKVHGLIKKKYGYEVPVIILKKSELEQLIKDNPFSNEAKEAPTKVLVSFFSEIPEHNQLQKLQAMKFEAEDYKIENNYAYLFCKNGYGKAKLNNNFLESKLKLNATTRNWKTILKLAGLTER